MKKIYKQTCRFLPALLALSLLSACGQSGVNKDDYIRYVSQIKISDTAVLNEAEAFAAPAAPDNILMPSASGEKTEKNAQAVIDYSNVSDGYVMAQYTAATDKKLKVQVTRETTYTYDLKPGEWTTFPLSDGSGEYKVTVFENVVDSKYSTVLSASFQASVADEFAPFLRPNQYVNYENAPNTIAKAGEVTSGTDDALEKVTQVYEFVINHLSYDKEKAQNIQSGYLPDLDTILAGDKGICFDYAALMTAMLRSQGIPCKLVVGYAGTAYHAWISVWSEETGWVDGAIYFDGTTWQRMDPTFISSSHGSASIQQFVGDGNNYAPKYLY